MMPTLTCDVRRAEEKTWAALSGEITERSDFAPLQEKTPLLVLDLSNVNRVNSAGVREWLRFVEGIRANSTRLVFERCSVAIVHQLNLVSNFRGGGEVRSVFTPYFCTKCNAEHVHLVELKPGHVEVDENVACPTCGSQMEFDDLSDQFLAFNGP